MRVEPFIQDTFNKYLSEEEDEILFTFHQRYGNTDSFNANVNIGIRKICMDMGMTNKEDFYCLNLITPENIGMTSLISNCMSSLIGEHRSSNFFVSAEV